MFNIALIGFVARRAAVGLALQAGRTPALLTGAYVALLVVCGLTGVAILFGRRWVVAGLAALVLVFAASTFVELAVGSSAPPLWLVLQLLIAIAGGGALIQLARYRAPRDLGPGQAGREH